MTANPERWTTFTAGFCLSYWFVYAFKIPILVYLPRRQEFHVFDVPTGSPDMFPAMFWYGWVLTGLVGGLAASAVVPGRIAARLARSIWLWPVFLALYTVYNEAHYFREWWT